MFAGVGGLLAVAVVIGVIAATAGRQTDQVAAPSTAAYQLPPKPAHCTAGTDGRRHPATGLDLGDVLVPRASLPRGWRTTTEALPMATNAQLVQAITGPAVVSPIASAPRTATSAPSSASAPETDATAPIFGLIAVDGRSADLRATGEQWLECLIHLPRYDGRQPLPPVVTNSQEDVTENGVAYAHLAARLTTGDATNRGGDAVYLVVVDTAPTVLAVGIAPLGDEAAQRALQKAMSGVQIRAAR